MYRVIVSCWPNWWKDSLHDLANLAPKPIEITVDGFNDTELNWLLSAMNVERSEIAWAVLDLMRVPRLSSLVAKHRERLKESGDVTAERVIYEDWKDRIERRGPRTGLSDLEMKEFVAKLGRELQQQIDRPLPRRAILEKLTEQSGKSKLELQPAVNELTSGAWLKTGDNSNTLKVAPNRIPFVLGAALIAHLRGQTDRSAVESSIAEFLDPLKAHRLGAAILRAATTIALIDDQTSQSLRETLLARWLDERNFGVNDFEAFWRLAGLDPNMFLDLAEARWLARATDTLRDEALIKSFANAAEFSSFAPDLKTRLTKWLGTAWPDPMVGAVLGRIDRTHPDSNRRATTTRSCHEAWVSSNTAQSFVPIQLDDDEGWSWLSPRALAILSFTKRAAFACVLEAWALSRAVMQQARHSDEVAWLLRFNCDDTSPTMEVVRNLISRLEVQKHPTCNQAATFLKSAMSHVQQTRVPLVLDEVSEKPPEKLNVSSLDADELYEAARRLFTRHDWGKYDPESSAALANALIERGLEVNEEGLGLVLEHLTDLLIVLTPVNRDKLLAAIDEEQQRIQGDTEAEKRTVAKLRLVRLPLELCRADPSIQSTLVLSSGTGNVHEEWRFLFRPVSSDDIAEIDFEKAPPERIAGWLEYLYEHLSTEAIKKLEWLTDLVTHEDPNVRHNALALAIRGGHRDALTAFAASRYSCPPKRGE